MAAWQRREITDKIIIEWLAGFAPLAGRPMSLPDGYRSFINRKNFLRSLTFRSHNMPLKQVVHLAIRQTLAQFNRFDN